MLKFCLRFPFASKKAEIPPLQSVKKAPNRQKQNGDSGLTFCFKSSKKFGYRNIKDANVLAAQGF